MDFKPMDYFKPVATKRINKHSFIMNSVPAKRGTKGAFTSLLRTQ